MLYCSILQVYFTYLCYITFWALEYHCTENLKLLLKENQIMAGFIIDQWSFHIDSMPFKLQTMIFFNNYKSNDGFYSPNSFYEVYLKALKNSWEHTVLMYSTAYNLRTFTWFVHFELPFRLKGTEKIHTERFFKFPLIYILFSM